MNAAPLPVLVGHTSALCGSPDGDILRVAGQRAVGMGDPLELQETLVAGPLA